MIGSDGALDDQAALRADRHERRPSRAILLAQSRRHDRDDLAMLAENEFERVVETPARVHLGRAQEIVLDLDRREKFAEQTYHVFRETRVAIAERVGNLRHRLSEMLGRRLAIRNVLGHFAQPVHVIDKYHQPCRPRGLELRKSPAHIRRPHDLAHRAKMRQPRRPEAALEDHRPRRFIRCDPLCKPPRFFTRPELCRGLSIGAIRFSGCARHCCSTVRLVGILAAEHIGDRFMNPRIDLQVAILLRGKTKLNRAVAADKGVLPKAARVLDRNPQQPLGAGPAANRAVKLVRM